jgi:hypothetical protein
MIDRPDYYAIYIETDERSGREVEYFETFNDAMDNRMKYANWFCQQGDIWIKRKSGKSIYFKTVGHIKT